jgi:hypothetical protein
MENPGDFKPVFVSKKKREEMKLAKQKEEEEEERHKIEQIQQKNKTILEDYRKEREQDDRKKYGSKSQTQTRRERTPSPE